MVAVSLKKKNAADIILLERDLDVIAYAGIPLIGSDGQALGTLCVIDDRPRHWRGEETALLQEIANAVVAQIESV